MVNAAGIKVLDTTQLKVNISGNVETAAANILREIYAAGAMDTSFQVDEAVATWNAGHALINTGDYWFYNSPLRWSKTLWGSEDETRYGYEVIFKQQAYRPQDPAVSAVYAFVAGFGNDHCLLRQHCRW